MTRSKETEFLFNEPVNFSKTGNEPTGFSIEAYTGSEISRPWGKLVLAVDGIQSKREMPILLNHDVSRIVGHSTWTAKDSSFRVSGVFSGSTDAAQEVKSLAKEGFPWQASIGVKPLQVVDLAVGKTMIVNGRQVSGPAEVWTESEVLETSFVPLGADGNTSVSTFAAARDSKDGNQKLKAEWNADAKLRAEFAGDFETYAAYMRDIPGVKVKVAVGPCAYNEVTK